MRIGFDAKRFFSNFTGLGNYSRFIVNALSETYPENEYLLYAPKLRSHPEVNSIIQNVFIKLKKPSQLTTSLRLGSFWRSYNLGKIAARDGVQLFHGLSNELPLTKPRQLKTVVTVHDLIFKRFPEFYKPVDIQIYNWKLRRACRLADKIIAISKQTSDDLIEFFNVEPSKIEVVYQGCQPNFKKTYTQEQLNAVQLRYNLPKEFILNVGTIESRKNVLVLLQSLKFLKHDLPVVVVGKATAYMKQLTDYIASNGLEKRVIFIHHAAFADLPAIYRLATVFVYPSLFEGFGIPLVEAITCDLPVITSKGSCFSEAAGPSSIYVDTENAELLAMEIDRVLGDDNLKCTMVSESKKFIEKFEPRNIAGGIMQVYTELLNENKIE